MDIGVNGGGSSVELFEDTLQAELNEDATTLTVQIMDSKRSGSGAWKYFGNLHRGGKSIDKKHTYCSLCLKMEKIKRYKHQTSTTNLLTHLSDVHSIDLKSTNMDSKQKKLGNYFSNQQSARLSVTETPSQDKQFRLARELTLWFARDLLPFSTVSTPGFQEFCRKYGIIKENSSLPNESTLSRSALSDVYTWVQKEVMIKIEQAPAVVSITMDCWTDNYKRLSYITYTAHWMTTSWTLENVTLRTSLLPHPHTGELINQDMQMLFEEYNLKSKKIIANTDCGANMIKACRLANVHRISCVAHGLHNLITRDLLGHTEMGELRAMLVKMRETHRSLIYRHDEIQKDWNSNNNEHLIKLIESHEDIERILEADDKQMDYTDDNGDYEDLQNMLNTKPTSLKRDMPTRWMSIFTMIESFVQNQQLVVSALEKLKQYDKILTSEELDMATRFLSLLKTFKDATDILQGQKFATINLALLFREEIMENLDSEYQLDDDAIDAAATILRMNLDKRFPVYPEYIGAAILDPKLKNLTIIATALAKLNQTRVQLLKSLANKFSICLDPNGSVANADTSNYVNTKRKKLDELVQKHTVQNVADSFQEEVEKYMVIPSPQEDDYDPIQWWRLNRNAFPQLSRLSSVLLSIPVTSGASERVFSVTGTIINARRSRINPGKVKKLLFIHDNYQPLHQRLSELPSQMNC